jgi:uncharacterized protein (TIGR02246 family)
MNCVFASRSEDWIHHRFLLIIATLLLGSLALPVSTCAVPDREISREEDIAAIKRFLSRAGEAVNRGDVEAELSRFTEDGIYMWPDAPSIHGQEAMRDWFARRFAQVDVCLENETTELEVCGDWAYEIGTYVAQIQPKGTDRVATVHGKYVNILHRQPDGSWRIARRIRNRDHPAEMP